MRTHSFPSIILIALLATALLLAASCQGTPTPTAKSPTPASTPQAFTLASPSASPQPTSTPLMIVQDGKKAPLYQLNPRNVDNSTLPVMRIDELHFTGSDPHFSADTWKLVVEGAGENPLTLTYADILARPVVSEVVLLICPGVFADNAEWSGVPLSLILNEAKFKPEAADVRFTSGDGYTFRIPLTTAMADGAFLAYKVNGQPLPSEHGFPLRLVVRGEYGSACVKWLVNITVLPRGS